MDTRFIQGTSCTISLHHCRCFETLSKKEMDFIDSNSVVIDYEKLVANHNRIREELDFQLKQERKKRRKTLFGSLGIGGLALIATILILK